MQLLDTTSRTQWDFLRLFQPTAPNCAIPQSYAAAQLLSALFSRCSQG